MRPQQSRLVNLYGKKRQDAQIIVGLDAIEQLVSVNGFNRLTAACGWLRMLESATESQQSLPAFS